MRSVDDHLALALATVRVVRAIDLALPDALDCVLAAATESAVALPAFDNSSMDGYAVVAADLAGASEDAPVVLPVVGDLPAGGARCPPVAGQRRADHDRAPRAAGRRGRRPGRVDRRRHRPGRHHDARRRRARTSAASARTSSPGSRCWLRGRGWPRATSGCSPPPGTTGCGCTRARASS